MAARLRPAKSLTPEAISDAAAFSIGIIKSSTHQRPRWLWCSRIARTSAKCMGNQTIRVRTLHMVWYDLVVIHGYRC